MGIFSRSIDRAYKPAASVPIAVASPWQPTDTMTQITVDELISAEMREGNRVPVTRDVALRVPGVKRAHGVHCTMFAEISFRQTDANGVPVAVQPNG